MKTERRFQGVAVSPGIARGVAFVHRPEEVNPPRRRVTDVEAEIGRLNEALTNTRRQIGDLHQEMAKSLGAKDAAVFEAHLMVVDDGSLINEVHATIKGEQCNAEHGYWSVMQRYARSFAQIDDPYLRERAVDIHDVARRVIHNLMGKNHVGLAALPSPHIVFAHNLTPSDTAQMNRANVLGFGTETVGTDHGQGGHFSPPYPAHTILHGAGKYGLQCLKGLDRLPPTGAILVAAPLKILDGSGSPLRVIAFAERTEMRKEPA